MIRNQSSSASAICTLIVAPILLCAATDVWATDEIICQSAKFTVTFAVGDEGYVPSMVITNTSREYFSENLVITELKRRRVWIQSKSVDVEAALAMKDTNRIVIRIRRGKGFIRLNSLKERMTCDWDI